METLPEELQAEGYSLVTPVLVSNLSSEDRLEILSDFGVKIGDRLMAIEK